MISVDKSPPASPDNAGTDPKAPHFSIRRFVESKRGGGIGNHWPFSQQYLLLCLKNGVRNLLPPFERSEMRENGFSSLEAMEEMEIRKMRKIGKKNNKKKKKKRSMAEILSYAPRTAEDDAGREGEGREGKGWRGIVEEGCSEASTRRSSRGKKVVAIRRTRSSSRKIQRKNYREMDEDDEEHGRRKLRKRAEPVLPSKAEAAVSETPSPSSVLLDGDHEDHDLDLSMQTDEAYLETSEDKASELLHEDPRLKSSKDALLEIFREDNGSSEKPQEDPVLGFSRDGALELFQEEPSLKLSEDRVLELFLERPSAKISEDPSKGEENPTGIQFLSENGISRKKKASVLRLMGKNLAVFSQSEDSDEEAQQKRRREEPRVSLGFLSGPRFGELKLGLPCSYMLL